MSLYDTSGKELTKRQALGKTEKVEDNDDLVRFTEDVHEKRDIMNRDDPGTFLAFAAGTEVPKSAVEAHYEKSDDDDSDGDDNNGDDNN